ncbi:hypothetical protein [Nitrosomonas marina]|uniref:Uncharacterized protein n=1 Tax=Nitrosomonas marina TaxID=917 RepID=A0A1H8IPF6_9PROT|nr:hypothetical protein [Nitrosomonas marina]SEN69867.1 hypothetical protein SAMN05216325_13612 [Nitrosomonas marina]
MWFREIAKSEEPGKEELKMFVKNIRDFLGYVLEHKNHFSFLWEESPELYDLAWETFRYDIAKGAGLDLDNAIEGIPQPVLRQHGLLGRPLRFKFRVLNSIAEQWDKIKDQFSIREWFKKIIDAIDAILDSLIDATNGVGGLIKEFKDALSALVPISPNTGSMQSPR